MCYSVTVVSRWNRKEQPASTTIAKSGLGSCEDWIVEPKSWGDTHAHTQRWAHTHTHTHTHTQSKVFAMKNGVCLKCLCTYCCKYVIYESCHRRIKLADVFHSVLWLKCGILLPLVIFILCIIFFGLFFFSCLLYFFFCHECVLALSVFLHLCSVHICYLFDTHHCFLALLFTYVSPIPNMSSFMIFHWTALWDCATVNIWSLSDLFSSPTALILSELIFIRSQRVDFWCGAWFSWLTSCFLHCLFSVFIFSLCTGVCMFRCTRWSCLLKRAYFSLEMVFLNFDVHFGETCYPIHTTTWQQENGTKWFCVGCFVVHKQVTHLYRFLSVLLQLFSPIFSQL